MGEVVVIGQSTLATPHERSRNRVGFQHGGISLAKPSPGKGRSGRAIPSHPIASVAGTRRECWLVAVSSTRTRKQSSVSFPAGRGFYLPTTRRRESTRVPTWRRVGPGPEQCRHHCTAHLHDSHNRAARIAASQRSGRAAPRGLRTGTCRWASAPPALFCFRMVVRTFGFRVSWATGVCCERGPLCAWVPGFFFVGPRHVSHQEAESCGQGFRCLVVFLSTNEVERHMHEALVSCTERSSVKVSKWPVLTAATRDTGWLEGIGSAI